ncbi:wd-repeat protein [Anopheles darlingi]|uniref:Wd-repeat protein n=1 Tax=Anopheles darlingi TaxID=43151 RepID=W5JK40_ANODA|nr:wd-repeat protein [Anopheles darlingi]
MDYKVHIDAGKEDCYFQYVRQGSTLYVSFHVIRGGDGMAGFAVRNPRGEIVHPYQWQTNSDYTDAAAMGGFYAVCIDNQFSRFASKLINLYITVIRYEEWEKFTKEIEDLNVNLNNFTSTISTVERNLNAMFQYQAHSRNNEARDYALIVDNNAYVWKWSVLQILVIIFTCSVQVYFVRKLFDIKTALAYYPFLIFHGALDRRSKLIAFGIRVAAALREGPPRRKKTSMNDHQRGNALARLTTRRQHLHQHQHQSQYQRRQQQQQQQRHQQQQEEEEERSQEEVAHDPVEQGAGEQQAAGGFEVAATGQQAEQQLQQLIVRPEEDTREHRSVAAGEEVERDRGDGDSRPAATTAAGRRRSRIGGSSATGEAGEGGGGGSSGPSTVGEDIATAAAAATAGSSTNKRRSSRTRQHREGVRSLLTTGSFEDIAQSTSSSSSSSSTDNNRLALRESRDPPDHRSAEPEEVSVSDEEVNEDEVEELDRVDGESGPRTKRRRKMLNDNNNRNGAAAALVAAAAAPSPMDDSSPNCDLNGHNNVANSSSTSNNNNNNSNNANNVNSGGDADANGVANNNGLMARNGGDAGGNGGGANSSSSSSSSGGGSSGGHSHAHRVVKLDRTNQDIVRLIGQHLKDIGLERSAEMLMQESGCCLEHRAATKFRAHVLSGDWTKADHDLQELASMVDSKTDRTSMSEMKFLLLEQKYLEFLEEGRPIDALHVLRNELTPLQHRTPRVHQLSSYMMCTNNQELYQRAGWEGRGVKSRSRLMDQLQSYLPATVMLPPRRLRSLLAQAVEMQNERCQCHDMAWSTSIENVSLLVDHNCGSDGFPLQALQVLNDHSDEVWFCKFSPDGLRLATGSKDNTVIVWEVDPVKLLLRNKRSFEGHTYGVSYIAWSPDSKYFIACGPDDCPDLWIWDVEQEKLITKFSHSTDDSLTCAAFNRDGTRFVTGGTRGQFYMVDLDGSLHDNWEGVRVNGLAFLSDNKTVLAADTHYRIRGYSFDNPRTDYGIVQEQCPIMTFSVNSADRLALLNISSQGLHLWDLQDKCLVRRFQGVTQGNYTIYSCFGGVNESFVASGSEDNKVYIWHIRREEPLATLIGHTRTVNCVSWNPVYPSLLASASDDGTVRIWGPQQPHSQWTPNGGGIHQQPGGAGGGGGLVCANGGPATASDSASISSTGSATSSSSSASSSSGGSGGSGAGGGAVVAGGSGGATGGGSIEVLSTSSWNIT